VESSCHGAEGGVIENGRICIFFLFSFLFSLFQNGVFFLLRGFIRLSVGLESERWREHSGYVLPVGLS